MSKSRPKRNNSTAPTEEKIPDEAYTYAVSQLEKGHDATKVAECLVNAGYSSAEAEKIVAGSIAYLNNPNRARAARAELLKETNTTMLIGLGLLVLGGLITAGSMLSAGPGEAYYVTGGLMVTGFVIMIRAHAQSGR